MIVRACLKLRWLSGRRAAWMEQAACRPLSFWSLQAKKRESTRSMIAGLQARSRRRRAGSSASGRWQYVARAARRPRTTSSESAAVGPSAEPAEASSAQNAASSRMRGEKRGSVWIGSVEARCCGSELCPFRSRTQNFNRTGYENLISYILLIFLKMVIVS